MKIKENHLLILIFLIYLIAVVFVGSYHEPWFDEAQAWLIARDNSYIDILQALKTEGHPYLWYYILRTLYLCGLNYEHLYLISIFFSSIGVYLLLFKTDFPVCIKALVPFSYPIFYQHAVISRSYCLVLPTLMLFSLFYRKYRYSNPFLIIAILIFLAGISLHTMVLSFILLCVYIYDLCKNKKFSIKIVQSVPFLLYYYVFIYSFLDLGQRNITDLLDVQFSSSVLDFCLMIKCFIFTFCEPVYVGAIFVITLLYLLLFSFFKSHIKSFFLLLGILCFYYFFLMIKLSPWHCDLLLIFLISIFSITFKEEHKNISKNKLFYSVFFFIFFYSLYYTISSSYFDVKNRFDSSKVIANWIKYSDYSHKKIYAYSFKPYAIHPYFDKPIFVNTEKSWFDWLDFLSGELNEHFSFFNKNIFKEIELYNPDIIIFSTFSENRNLLYEYLESKNINYKKTCINATMYYKNHKLEHNGYCMLFLHEDPNNY